MTLWLCHLTSKIVPEMTYNVSSGTLNPTYCTIPYYHAHLCASGYCILPRQWIDGHASVVKACIVHDACQVGGPCRHISSGHDWRRKSICSATHARVHAMLRVDVFNRLTAPWPPLQWYVSVCAQRLPTICRDLVTHIAWVHYRVNQKFGSVGHLVRHRQVLRCPPLRFGPLMSGPAFSAPPQHATYAVKTTFL